MKSNLSNAAKRVDVPHTEPVWTRNPRRWGTTLDGTGDIAVAARALEDALEAFGMTCRHRTVEENRIEITARQEAPWYAIIFRCLPQRADWLLLQKGQRQEIAGDLYSFLWYRWMIAFLGVAATIGIGTIWLVELGVFEGMLDEPTFRYLILATIATFIMLACLLLGGGRHREHVWQSLLAEVESAGGSLVPTKNSLGPRRLCIYVVLLTMAFSLGALAIKDAVARPSFGTLVGLAVFTAVVVFLLAAVVLMARRTEARYRSDGVVIGLSTLVTVLFFFAPAYMWMAVGDSAEILSRLRKVEHAHYAETSSFQVLLSGRESSDAEEYVAWQTKAWQILLVSVSPLIAALALFIFMVGLRSSHYAAFLKRLQQEKRRESPSGLAIRAGPHLNFLRLVFGMAWALVAFLILGTLLMLVLAGVQAVIPSFPFPQVDFVASFASVLRLALGDLVDAAVLTGLARLAWVGYAAVGLALFAMSLGQLYLTRRAWRRALLRAGGSKTAESEQARRILDRLVRGAKLVGVELVVLPTPRPEASAECFFRVGRRERFVVLGEGALSDFDEPELEAVLAHELIHLRDGHCRKMTLLRWLGRLTFVGDGFVLALQDSFGYEKAADRILLEESLASATALERSLVKMMHAAGGWQGKEGALSGREIPRQIREDRDRMLSWELPELPFRQRLTLGWWFFRRQYFRAVDHYWHPSYRERREAVRAWTATGCS